MKDALWSNTQWAVTTFGLESVHPNVEYLIPRERLGDVLHPTVNVGFWPVQMAQKSWADDQEFWQAYVKALELHEPKGLQKIDFDATLRKVATIRLSGKCQYDADLS